MISPCDVWQNCPNFTLPQEISNTVDECLQETACFSECVEYLVVILKTSV